MSGTKEQEQQVKQIIRDVVSGPNSHAVFEQMSKDPWIYDPIVEEEGDRFIKAWDQYLVDKEYNTDEKNKDKREEIVNGLYLLQKRNLYELKHIKSSLNNVIKDPNA